ncbi:hypothetical protein V2J09_015397 [Rumex salicifolius]
MDGVVNSRMYGNGGCSSDRLAHFPSSSSSHILESLWVPNSSASIHERSMINFEDYTQASQLSGARRSRPSPENDEEDDESSETEEMRNSYRRPEKKRRLTTEQVRQLEKSFEVETKLEPQRKVHLANELGLEPRQVAIWFQNRRARFKTKQIEKDYDSLKSNYDSLKADFDSLLKEKERLQNEVSSLTKKLNQKDVTGPVDPVQVEQFEAKAVVAPICKQEAASSAKSDMSDNSGSPHCTEGNYTSELEGVAVKPELSPEVEDLRRSFRPAAEYGFGDVFEVHGSSSCNLGLPVPAGVEDNSNYWSSWLY